MGNGFDFSGTWHSAYHYQNDLEPEGNYSEHDVKIYVTGNQVVMQSVPNPEGSYFVARLMLDDKLKLLTGTWQEQSSPTGLYKGQIYYGACQAEFDTEKGTITGIMTMYNHEMKLITGDWKLERTTSEE